LPVGTRTRRPVVVISIRPIAIIVIRVIITKWPIAPAIAVIRSIAVVAPTIITVTIRTGINGATLQQQDSCQRGYGDYKAFHRLPFEKAINDPIA
jgi:hypothetical protein